MDKKRLNILFAIQNINKRNLLLLADIILIGCLVLFSNFQNLTDIVQLNIIYIAVVVATIIRTILFSFWKRNYDCKECYIRILVITNIYALLAMTGCCYILIHSIVNYVDIEYFLFAVSLSFLTIPVIVYIDKTVYTLAIIINFILVLVFGIIVNFFANNLDIYLLLLIINIFTIAIVISKNKSEIENYYKNITHNNYCEEQSKLIAKLVKENQEYRKDKIIDSLTDVYNRNYLYLEFENLKNSNDVIALCLIEVQNFNQINRDYGRSKADSVLRQLATLIKENSISNNGMAFRFDGYEFVMLFHNVEIDVAKKYMNELEQIIKQTYFIDAPTIKVLVHTGITTFKMRKDLDLLHQIDLAFLYSQTEEKKAKR